MLLQRYLVDPYVKIESEHLAFTQNNQLKLQAENDIHLLHALWKNKHIGGIDQVGHITISLPERPRYLH